MKKCPYCAEDIQDAAIVCKHCGRELAPGKVVEVSKSISAESDAGDTPRPNSLVDHKTKGIATPQNSRDSTNSFWHWFDRNWGFLILGGIIVMIYVLYRDAAEIQNFETSVQNIIAAPQGRADLESYMAEVRPMLASFAEITTNGISGQETITATSDAMIDLLGQFEAYANRIEDPEISVVHQWTKSWLRDSASAWVLLRHQEQGMVIGNRAELCRSTRAPCVICFRVS